MGQVNTAGTGNAGAGTKETTSSPDPVVSGGTAGVPATGEGSQGTMGADVGLTDADFKKDGNLRKDAVRRIQENAPARGAERSFNEVTGETTVTTVVNGQTVTFVEDGDTRGEERPRATDSAVSAMDSANEEKE